MSFRWFFVLLIGAFFVNDSQILKLLIGHEGPEWELQEL